VALKGRASSARGNVNFRSMIDVLFDRCASSVVWFTATAVLVAIVLFTLGFGLVALAAR